MCAGDRVPAADHGVLARLAREPGRGRPQAQGLVEDLPDVPQTVDLFEGGRRGGAEHLVDLGAGAGEDVRVVEQVVDREREQPRGRLVPGDEEGDALGPDVLIRQHLPGLLVDAGEHPPEQVGGVGSVPLRAALGDDLVDQVVHERLVLVELALRADPQAGLDGQLAHAVLRLLQHPDHRLDERVRGLAVEGVEPVAEPAQRDRVQRQPGHVRRDVDLLARVDPGPLVHQLVREVEHLGHVVAHRLQAERRHEDVVRAGPERVVGVGGEQPRPDGSLAQVGQAAGDLLVEPFVVADLVHQLRARHEQPHTTRCDDLEQRSVLLRHPDEAAERVGPVDVESVAHQRQGPGPGDVLEGIGIGARGGHVGLPVSHSRVVGRGQVDLLQHPQQVEHPRERGRVRPGWVDDTLEAPVDGADEVDQQSHRPLHSRGSEACPRVPRPRGRGTVRTFQRTCQLRCRAAPRARGGRRRRAWRRCCSGGTRRSGP